MQGTPGQVLSSTGTGVEWTNASTGTVTNIATTAPITGGPITTTGTIGITQATSTTDGYLSSTDWNTFNNKASGTGTTNILPIWTDGPNGILGDSVLRKIPGGGGGTNSYLFDFSLDSTVNGAFNIIQGGSIEGYRNYPGTAGYNFKTNNAGGFYSSQFSFQNKLNVDRSSNFTNPSLDVGASANAYAAAWFRNGVVISNNPSGVQVDNTSMVIGAGNNDNVSGSDHCLIVGSGNQILNNSDQSVAFGQGNTITDSTDAFSVGNSNTITSSQRTLSLGYNNDINSASSFVAGGDNAVNGLNTNMVLGYSHQVTNDQNFVVGNQLISDGNKMVLGYRNQTTYPTPDEPLGLGFTKFVVATGSSTTNNSNALLITEGGRQSGGVNQVPRVILPTIVNFNFPDDAAAAAGGIPIGGLYHDAGMLRIRLV